MKGNWGVRESRVCKGYEGQVSNTEFGKGRGRAGCEDVRVGRVRREVRERRVYNRGNNNDNNDK